MFSNMDTSNSNDQSQGRSPGQVPPIMLLLQQLLGLPYDQQTGAGANQDAPSAPPSTFDHQDQPPPPPFQSAPGPQHQQTPPPTPSSAPGHQHQQIPHPPSGPGHQHQQTPPPPQQNQFCSNCSGSRRRQDDCRQYLENMIPIIINKCKHFSAVFTRSM